MAYAGLSEAIQEAVEILVKAGVSRAVVESAMQGVEWECLMDLRQANEDQRLLDLFARYETADIAKRYGKSPRRMRDLRTAAVNRLFLRRTASA